MLELTWPFANTPFSPSPASAPLVPLVVVAVVCVVVGWLTPEGLVLVKLFADMMEMCRRGCDCGCVLSCDEVQYGQYTSSRLYSSLKDNG